MGGVTKDTHLVAHMVASWGQGRAQWEGQILLPSEGVEDIHTQGQGAPLVVALMVVGGTCRALQLVVELHKDQPGKILYRAHRNICLGDIPENSRGLGTSL